jgi:hypothetical protein
LEDQHERVLAHVGPLPRAAARQPIAGACESAHSHGGVGQVFREGIDRLIVRGKGFLVLMLEIGGEGGIRTLPPPIDSVTSRFYSASVAVDAVAAVAHCPLLPAG